MSVTPSGHAAGGDSPTWPPVPLCFHQEIPRMTEFECILDEPISSAWPVASDWLETFLHDGGNRWDHRIASVMTADAVTAALAHSTRPVRLVGATTGATAQIGLQAHSTGQPQEWTALSPDRRGCAAAAAPTHPTLRRRSPPQHGRGRNLALVPPAAARDRHPPAAAPTERFRNLEPDPRAAGRVAGECARHPGTTDVAELGGRSVRPAADAVRSGPAADALPARCPSGGGVVLWPPPVGSAPSMPMRRCRTCRAHLAAQTGTRLSVAGGTAVCTSRSSVCSPARPD